MAKSKSPAAGPQATNDGVPDMRAMFETNGAAMAAAAAASEAMIQGMAELNREMMNFTSDRLHKGMQTSESLASCQHPAEAFNVQCEHARAATQAYFDQATRLMGLAAKMSDQYLRSMEVQTRETSERATKTE